MRWREKQDQKKSRAECFVIDPWEARLSGSGTDSDARRRWELLATSGPEGSGICKEREREDHASAWGKLAQSASPQS